jgi:hypothetical protein
VTDAAGAHAGPDVELTATFEVTGWEEIPYDEPAQGPKLSRVTVHKQFRGALEGESTAELLTAVAASGRGYVASEGFSGTVDGRRGTVVFQHGGLDDGRDSSTFGQIVPGSGTGELEGLAGQITYQHDESGARVTLRLRTTLDYPGVTRVRAGPGRPRRQPRPIAGARPGIRRSSPGG